MLSIGAYPWADVAVTGNYTNIPEKDKPFLARVGGGVPYLAYIWHQNEASDWKAESWAWLARAGYRQPVLRLWYPGNAEHPADLPDYKSCTDGLTAKLNECLAAYDPLLGINLTMEPICLQFDNEPNLEHRTMKIAAYEPRMKDAVKYLREKFPTQKIGSPPLAQAAYPSPAHPDIESYDKWVEMIVRNAGLFDYICIHHYLDIEPGDRAAGFKNSPEWWRTLIPNKPILVTETGSNTVQENFGTEMRRWLSYNWVEGVFPFILSHPSGWEKWTFNEHSKNLVLQLVKEYRQSRRFPKGASTVVQPPATGGDVDVNAILGDLNTMWGYATVIDQAYQEALIVAGRLGESGNALRERIISIKNAVV